jgi:hypothetical protein
LLAAALAAAVTGCSGATSGPPPHAVTDHLGSVDHLTVADGFIYWTQLDSVSADTWSVRRVAETGGTPEVLAADVARPLGLAADGARVLWTSYADRNLYVVPVTGAAPGAAPTVITTLAAPAPVVLVGGTAYVRNDLQLLSSTIVSVRLDDGAQTEVASGTFGGIATDGQAVYFIRHDFPCASLSCVTSSVMRYAPGDAAPATVLSAPAFTDTILVDHGTLFLLAQSGDKGPDDLWSVPAAGGTPAKIATGIPASAALAATRDTLYWTAGGLFSLARTGTAAPASVSSDDIGPLAADEQKAFGVITTADGDTAIVALGP